MVMRGGGRTGHLNPCQVFCFPIFMMDDHLANGVVDQGDQTFEVVIAYSCSHVRKLICISSIIQQSRQLDLFDVYQFGIAVNNYGSPHSLVKLLDTLLCTYTECLKYVVLPDNVAKLPLDVFLFEDLNTKLDDCSTAARSFPSRCLCAVLPLMVFEEAKKRL